MLGDQLPSALKMVQDLIVTHGPICDVLLHLCRLDCPFEPKAGRLRVFLLGPTAFFKRIAERLNLCAVDDKGLTALLLLLRGRCGIRHITVRRRRSSGEGSHSHHFTREPEKAK